MKGSKTIAIAVLALSAASGAQAQQPAPPQLPQAPNMTFFVTSVGLGKGADLGGLEGADRHCQQLAERHGAGGKTWRAYLSTQAAGSNQAVNARDRIGKGPWQNFKGETVAESVDDLLVQLSRAVPFRRARIAPAATGRAAPRARRWSAISIARGCATTRRRGRGTLPTPPEVRMAAAARTI
jgi:hypothetical protein